MGIMRREEREWGIKGDGPEKKTRRSSGFRAATSGWCDSAFKNTWSPSRFYGLPDREPFTHITAPQVLVTGVYAAWGSTD